MSHRLAGTGVGGAAGLLFNMGAGIKARGAGGPHSPQRTERDTCQEQASIISKDLGRGKLAAKLNLREFGF